MQQNRIIAVVSFLSCPPVGKLRNLLLNVEYTSACKLNKGAKNMLKGICTIFSCLYHLLLKEEDPIIQNKNNLDDAALLTEAKQKWQAAHSFFNYVNDEKQIDQAIFNLIAAEKHYDYLLQKARREHWYKRKVSKEV